MDLTRVRLISKVNFGEKSISADLGSVYFEPDLDPTSEYRSQAKDRDRGI